MTFNWYLLFNLTEFLATDLISRTLTVVLEEVGEKEILIIRGNETSIVYEDVLLPIEFQGDNPVIREGEESNYAVYKDTNQGIWLGIEAEA